MTRFNFEQKPSLLSAARNFHINPSEPTIVWPDDTAADELIFGRIKGAHRDGGYIEFKTADYAQYWLKELNELAENLQHKVDGVEISGIVPPAKS